MSLSFGYLPSNAYNRYFSGSASGVYKYSPNWGWEILRIDGMFPQETDLKKELREEFEIDVQNQNFGGRFLPITGILRTGLVWEPFYNKGLFVDTQLIYSNLSVLVNLGYIFYEKRGGQFMTGIGGIYKIYLSSHHSLKIDLRQNFVFDDTQGMTDFTELSLGLGFHFGGEVL